MTTDPDFVAHMAEDLANGSGAKMHKTHPNLYLMMMLAALTGIALGLNFLLLDPTFLIYQAPNELWGACFLTIGVSEVLFLNVYRNLRAVRIAMGFGLAYALFIALGACEPFLHGVGSLQLPIVYVFFALSHLPLMGEPFVNPAMRAIKP